MMMGHGFILLTLHGCIDVRLTPRGIAVRVALRDNPNAIDVRLTPRGIAVRVAPCPSQTAQYLAVCLSHTAALSCDISWSVTPGLTGKSTTVTCPRHGARYPCASLTQNNKHLLHSSHTFISSS